MLGAGCLPPGRPLQCAALARVGPCGQRVAASFPPCICPVSGVPQPRPIFSDSLSGVLSLNVDISCLRHHLVTLSSPLFLSWKTGFRLKYMMYILSIFLLFFLYFLSYLPYFVCSYLILTSHLSSPCHSPQKCPSF